MARVAPPKLRNNDSRRGHRPESGADVVIEVAMPYCHVMYPILVGGLKHFETFGSMFDFPRMTWGWLNNTNIFQLGVIQPPTSYGICCYPQWFTNVEPWNCLGYNPTGTLIL